jgi:hypothetical protein
MKLPLALVNFWASWGKAVLIALAVIPAAFLLGQCDGAKKERNRAAAARAEANVEAMKTNEGATATAADERMADAAQVDAQEERLVDAIQSTPDSRPDSVRVALGCERLRAAGTDTAAIPACR